MFKRTVSTAAFLVLGMLALMGSAYATQQSGGPGQQGGDKNRQDANSKAAGNAATNTSMQLGNADKRFVMDAAHGGMMEVELGRLAVERASSDAVKQFAQRMIDDHSRANTELMELASRKGVTLPGMTHGDSSTNSNVNTGSDTNRADSGSQAGKTDTQSAQQGGQRTGSQTSDRGAASMSDQGSKRGGADSDTMGAKHRAMADKLSQLSGAEFDREYMRQQVKDHEKAVEMFERESRKGNDGELKAWAEKTLPTLREHLRMARDIAGTTGGSSDKNKSNKDNTESGKRP